MRLVGLIALMLLPFTSGAGAQSCIGAACVGLAPRFTVPQAGGPAHVGLPNSSLGRSPFDFRTDALGITRDRAGNILRTDGLGLTRTRDGVICKPDANGLMQCR